LANKTGVVAVLETVNNDGNMFSTVAILKTQDGHHGGVKI